jgi:hypothetical protein
MKYLDLTGLQAFWTKIKVFTAVVIEVVQNDLDNFKALKGEPNGLAELDETGKVPSSQLPSYVDDIHEYDSLGDFPATGESGKIYVATDTNKTYRWGGSEYVLISESLALGETSATAYRGDRGKAAYDHSQIADGSNPHQTTFANIASKPTTLAGYGITDAVASSDLVAITTAEIDALS